MTSSATALAVLPPQRLALLVSNDTVVSSRALLGMCTWTFSDTICYATVIPILCLTGLVGLVLLWSFVITDPKDALNATIQPRDSPLLPEAYRHFDDVTLHRALSGVNEQALKTFLPRIGLEELVEPCAIAGVASIKDLLRADRLVIRDIGIGPKEQRVFARQLERRIRLREKMHGALGLAGGGSLVTRASRSLSSKRREAIAMSVTVPSSGATTTAAS